MSLGDFVNTLLDGLLATADRLLQLPVFAVLLAMAAAAAAIAGAVALVCRRPRLAWLRRPLLGLLALAVLTTWTWLIDRRLANLEQTLREVAARPAPAAPGSGNPASPKPAARALGFDLAAARAQWTESFGELQCDARVVDDAVDYVQLRLDAPALRVHVALVDLARPDCEVVLGTDLQRKTLTSAFAQQSQCFVAVNGEAGQSPFPGSGFGNWRGHFAWHGEVLMREEAGNPRPFLQFGPDNHASYRSQSATDRALAGAPWNAIWGRIDAIVDGEVQLADWGGRQPRTAMGIDRTGTRLALLVVDGRQPRFSMGATRAEVGMLLKPLGVHDAMLCDEGGSSCLWLAAMGGIVNSPSDGQERVTYTHFGIARRAAGRDK